MPNLQPTIGNPKTLSLAILPWTVTILSLAVVFNSIVTYRSIDLLRDEVSSTNEVLRKQMRVEMLFESKESDVRIPSNLAEETGT
jgi:hypothetical protein